MPASDVPSDERIRMSRTDIHSPKHFDPADYQVVDYLDNQPPPPPQGPYLTEKGIELWQAARAAWEQRIFQYFPEWRTGGDDHQSIHQCNHCGHPGIRWVAVVKHLPTGGYLAFGETCADRCELAGRDAFRAKFIKDRAAREQAALEKQLAREAFNAENSDVADYLHRKNMDGQLNEFLFSLHEQLERKGELSEAQVAAVRKNIVREQQFEQRKQAERDSLVDAPALPEGHREIEGEIVSAKVVDTPYGMAVKMLVREPTGNKVWGTMPRQIEEQLGSDGIAHARDRGYRVRFMATVERSQDDEHFGFYRRPSKSALVEAAKV